MLDELEELVLDEEPDEPEVELSDFAEELSDFEPSDLAAAGAVELDEPLRLSVR